MDRKAVVCYSGGHSSALVAIEAARRYGKENVVLLNHNISPRVEHADIKRFKDEVAGYIGVEITYANHPNFENMTPLAMSRKKRVFRSEMGNVFARTTLKRFRLTGGFLKIIRLRVAPHAKKLQFCTDLTQQKRIELHEEVNCWGYRGIKQNFPFSHGKGQYKKRKK